MSNSRHGAEARQINALNVRRPSARHSISDVIHDISELVELQLKLFATDFQATGRGMIVPMAVIVLGICLLLASAPVLLLSAAYYVHAKLDWTLPSAMAATGGGGLLVALLLTQLGSRRLRRRFQDLDQRLTRSRDEFSQNVAWVRKAIKRDPPGLADEATTISTDTAR